MKSLAILAVLFSALAVLINFNTVLRLSDGINVRVEDGNAIPTKHLTPVFNVMSLDAVSLSVLVETKKATDKSKIMHIRHTVRNAYASALFNDYAEADSTIISVLKPYGVHIVKLHVYKNVETIEFKAEKNVDLP